MQAERPDSERGTRAVLVALQTGGLSERGLTASLDELARLLETAGGVEAARVVQNAPSADPRTYIGSGKAKEIAEFIRNDGGIDLVVFDNELTPSQIRNLEDIFDVRVIDRTMLILDIFALHAVTGEGKLQVEIACLRYSAPRLTGKGKSLSRQGGTSGPIGSRGPGESKLELDRRRIRERISALNAELKDIEKTRAVNRSQRMRAGIPTAAIVGYTNAGKSTLLNRLTDAGILAEDKLFATLDPTTRRLSLPRGCEILLTDTVGFIDRLPKTATVFDCIINPPLSETITAARAAGLNTVPGMRMLVAQMDVIFKFLFNQTVTGADKQACIEELCNYLGVPSNF